MARILIIDDEEYMRRSLRRLLELEGFEVDDAPNGQTGLQLLQEQAADLVITDIFMPEIDGISTIREICRNYPAIKVIAISGGGRYGSLGSLEVAGYLGAHRTLYKPFANEKLLEVVKELLADAPPAMK